MRVKAVYAVNAGAFPRIGDGPDQRKLPDAIDAFESGRIGEQELAAVREETIRAVLADQARAGLDIVSDGQVRWHDPVSHLMGRLGGVRMGGLRRYFDTGRFYFRPRITGGIEAGRPLLADELKWARAVSMRPVTAILPGPLTLSRLAEVRGGPYGNADAVFEALVPILADEVENLVKAGAAAIIVEEPALLREPGALPLVAGAMEVLAARKGSIGLWLFPSLGDAAGIYDELQKLAVDGLMLDCSPGRKAGEIIAAAGSQLSLGLGLADARSGRVESASQLAALAAPMLRRVRAGSAWLCPSADLEYLPRNMAVQKLAALAEARDLVLGRRRPEIRVKRRRPKSKIRKAARRRPPKKRRKK